MESREPSIQEFLTIAGDPVALVRMRANDAERLQLVVTTLRRADNLTGAKSPDRHSHFGTGRSIHGESSPVEVDDDAGGHRVGLACQDIPRAELVPVQSRATVHFH